MGAAGAIALTSAAPRETSQERKNSIDDTTAGVLLIIGRISYCTILSILANVLFSSKNCTIRTAWYEKVQNFGPNCIFVAALRIGFLESCCFVKFVNLTFSKKFKIFLIYSGCKRL